MHVMNESLESTLANVPTYEQFVGRMVRLLREGRDWSQQELALRMQPYGYQWSQATVTRLESASRPIRVNELADLAALFEIPVSTFLDPAVQNRDDLDGLGDLERELADATEKRALLQAQLEHATQVQAELASALASTEGRIAILERWISRKAAARCGEGSPQP